MDAKSTIPLPIAILILGVGGDLVFVFFSLALRSNTDPPVEKTTDLPKAETPATRSEASASVARGDSVSGLRNQGSFHPSTIINSADDPSSSKSHFDPLDLEMTILWLDQQYATYRRARATGNELIRKQAETDFRSLLSNIREGTLVLWQIDVLAVEPDKVRVQGPRERERTYSYILDFQFHPGSLPPGHHLPPGHTLFEIGLVIGDCISLESARKLTNQDRVDVAAQIHHVRLEVVPDDDLQGYVRIVFVLTNVTAFGGPRSEIEAFERLAAEHISRAAKEGETPEMKAEATALEQERNELLRKHFRHKEDGGYGLRFRNTGSE